MNAPLINFTFDGRALTAKPGQTLAAALLDQGIRLVGRSFKYHRPRGILSAGIEEPNALVTVGSGGREEPNTRATDLYVYEGLNARSQNRWPSLSSDVGGVLSLVSKALPAGFYYKTFFGPPKLWLFYEQFIRRAAGLGPAPTKADPDHYAQRAAFCDVLVVGSGPAGLIAARDAVRAGKKVFLVEQDAELAPSLLRDPAEIEGKPGRTWAGEIATAVRTSGGRVLTRTSASGLWDDQFVCLSEKLIEPGQIPANGFSQRYWHVRAGEVVLATGAIERPLTFANNDLPGVMLSQAVRTYVTRFGVLPGKRVVVATTNDDGYLTARALMAAGAEVVVLDSRPAPAGHSSGVEVHNLAAPVMARGGKRGVKALVATVDGAERSFACDLVAMSGGFTPVVHLHMQAGGKLDWDQAAQAFVPGETRQNVRTVGLAAEPQPAETVGAAGNPKAAFVDFQNDVTVSDLDLAWREGYRSVEHLKRYTTLGMATDQGKTGNMAALDRIARREGITIPEAGLTTFRPPFTPVSMGALAGLATGEHAQPTRHPALYDLHAARNPIWLNAGYWKRPRAYPQGAETLAQAGLREARTVRTAVGMCDVSTLAKFEVQGPDAVQFLERVCQTTVGKLALGRGRYTFMAREDGLVFDDGTVWRLGDQRYLLTSSTGGASRMATWLSYVRGHLCADLKVSVTCVQEHYAAIAVAGPKSAQVMAALTRSEAPRHMSVVESTIAGAPVLLMAASFSGERAFEVHFDASQAEAVWQAIEAEVLATGGTLYGIEAMELLRIEKGHLVVGPDIDGRLTAEELGLGRMVNKAGGWIGQSCLSRPDFADKQRKQLIGLEAIDGKAIPEGSMLVRFVGAEAEGHVTASGLRVLEGGSIALAHLKGGQARHGEEIYAHSPTRRQTVKVRVTSPHFYDPAGERYRD
ncbi:2Fe-2S iron-sulfur cluster-binding protein [Novosphingobium sp.]|uniref:2Fe-2S iron-sulfur cluster-binding protein n=1 Tax=Novosphingobium sp. TaxID=1874826 RepID=UPI002600CB67|nr:2Fe-2S iron-sulfur cluster-binding protein [Novosphingobium sp.]MCC6924245.1 (2Fe-2S)-binding protein [Novosphingobium sp.]